MVEPSWYGILKVNVEVYRPKGKRRINKRWYIYENIGDMRYWYVEYEMNMLYLRDD